ncbi:MAG TPA: peptidylprolyl isomerase [Rhizomicrobium sp.]|jgi:cyclophilin family peptidyl-prolyl cis-trans isomerase|nr:peptidylprolyl isomerase [Rhizomicrobium sp.]
MRVASSLALAFLLGLCRVACAEPTVAIDTAMGTITVELDRAHAPKTVDNFLRYVAEGHYDGTLVYRVAPGFVIQAGSFNSATNSRPVHDPIPLEAGNGLTNLRGTIAMARQSEPDSATAEFFINLANNANLDRQPGDASGTTGYAVFGRVVSGMDVVDKIAAVPVAMGGPMPGQWPQTPIAIRRVRIVDSARPAMPAASTPP